MTILIKYALIGCWIAITGAGFILFVITDFSGFLTIVKGFVVMFALSLAAGAIMGIKKGLDDIKKAKNLSL